MSAAHSASTRKLSCASRVLSIRAGPTKKPTLFQSKLVGFSGRHRISAIDPGLSSMAGHTLPGQNDGARKKNDETSARTTSRYPRSAVAVNSRHEIQVFVGGRILSQKKKETIPHSFRSNFVSV